MRKPILPAAAAIAAFCASAVLGQSSWIGHYSFTEDGGKTAGGTAIVVTHELRIMDSDDGLIATIESNGYQTSKDLLCKVRISGNKAMLYFEGYGESNVFEMYTKGQHMLTLEQKTEKGKSVLLTHWAAFKPIVSKNEKNGKVYFQRTEERTS